MSLKEYRDATVETAINVIKQKHFKDIDAEDFAFLKAREEYLSDADKEIYLEGKNPNEVIVETTPLTREERIINENRPLQEQEHAVRQARNAAIHAEALAGLPKVGDAKTEADKQLQEDREAKIKSLNQEVDTLKKEEERAEKERVAEEKEAAKADKKNK